MIGFILSVKMFR